MRYVIIGTVKGSDLRAFDFVKYNGGEEIYGS